MITSESQVPPPQAGISFERGKDPWHADAFKGIPDVEGQFISPEPRKDGWYYLDWCGNVVGWCADGTEFPD